MKASLAKGMPHGYEVGYGFFTINGRMLGHGEPIRVKQGERVLFHVLNGSATEIRSLALPGPFCSKSSRSMAIRFRILREFRCSGSARRSESPPLWR